MAIYYVAHKYGANPENFERAKKITHDLQVADLENTYICPLLVFSHLHSMILLGSLCMISILF